jgi:MFS family permease
MDFISAQRISARWLRFCAPSMPKSAMGLVFGCGYFGILIGSLWFGYLGDKYSAWDGQPPTSGR